MPRLIDGSATLTMLTSSRVKNSAEMQTPIAAHRRGSRSPAPSLTRRSCLSLLVAQRPGLDVEQDVVGGRGAHLAAPPGRQDRLPLGLGRPAQQGGQGPAAPPAAVVAGAQVEHPLAVAQPALVLPEPRLADVVRHVVG